MKKTLQELLEQIWIKRNGEIDQKMIDYCIKSGNHIDMGDYWLNIGKNKPTIDKTLYFADTDYSTGEYITAPKNTWELFKSYNMRMNSNEKWLEELEKSDILLRPQYKKTGSSIMSWTNADNWRFELVEGERIATSEEKEIIIKALKESDKKYLTRLERYYKRYSDKVWTQTYWADR